MIECENRQDSACLLASSLTGKIVATTDAACAACCRDDSPRTFNKVICSLSYAATKDYKWVEAWHQCNNTFFNKPGTHLKRLFQDIGIASQEFCGCDEYAGQMDRWGIQGCLLNRSEIIEHLNSQTVSWLNMSKVALAGYLTTGSLVDECIKRAKVLH
jgi:hypothetical protein